MTTTIGSQTDVPAPGDPIVSPWYQDTAKKLVHVFASTTARDAWLSPPEGAVCQAPAGVWWNRVAGAWQHFTMGFVRVGLVGGADVAAAGTGSDIGHLDLPAGTHLVAYSVLLSSTAGLSVNMKMFAGGPTWFVHQTRSADTLRSVAFTVPVTLASAGAVSVNLENVGAATVSCFADPLNHRIAAVQSS